LVILIKLSEQTFANNAGMALNGAVTGNPVVIVHGGAWNIPDHLLNGSIKGAKASARAAYQILKDGGTALDAVLAAVRALEDDVCFDAGKY
jgi:isoaspartyl peptidase/L-asparaginase-like protein (Ntn-hydrolase superfamily)